jgi:hypothetical protein
MTMVWLSLVALSSFSLIAAVILGMV